MSHPIHDPLAVTVGRIQRLTAALTDPATAAAYTPDERSSIVGYALALAAAADDPRGQLRTLARLTTAQASLDDDPTEDRAVLVIGLCDDQLDRVHRQRADGVDAMCRAQARAVHGADPNPRPRTR